MTTLKNKPLKYVGYSVVFQEVPNEISLAINISGCPYKCEGCHSKYLQEYRGNILFYDIEHIIKNNSAVTCICFMGGEQNLIDLEQNMNVAKSNQLKICLYSGSDNISYLTPILKYLDYLKIGSYQKDKGGLDNINTNQKMFTVLNGKLDKDITYMFQKKYKYRSIV